MKRYGFLAITLSCMLCFTSASHAFFGIVPIGVFVPKWKYSVPFFEESGAALVVSFNPKSDVVSDPVIRDVLSSVLLVEISDEENFPRLTSNDITGQLRGVPISAPAYRGVTSENRKALDDVGGLAPHIVEIAEKAGLSAQVEMPQLNDLTQGSLEEDVTFRTMRRNSLRRLEDAGYRINSADGSLVTENDQPVDISLLIAGHLFSEQQIAAITNAAARMGTIGIRVDVKADRTTTGSASNREYDIKVQLSPITKTMFIPDFYLSEWEDTPLGEFSDNLGSLTQKEELTAYVLIEKYLVKNGYLFALAETSPVVDYSDRKTRAATWRKGEAMEYVYQVCNYGVSIPDAYVRGQSEMETWFGNFPNGFVFSLPSNGDLETGMSFGMLAAERYVGIPDKGVLRFVFEDDAPAALRKEILDGGSFEIEVQRDGHLLEMLDEQDYLSAAESMFVGQSDPIISSVQYLSGTPGATTAIKEDVPDWLASHEFSDLQRCAAKVSKSDRPLVFSENATE